MSTNQGYQQSAASAAALDAGMEAMRDKPAGRLPEDANVPHESSARGIPGYYHTQDAQRDTMEAYRFAAANNNMGAAVRTGTGVDQLPANAQAALRNFKVELTPKDVEYFERLRQEEQQIDYDNWITQRINISDPGESRWLQTIHPEFWTRRERFIDDQINKESRAAKIKARGIRDKHDMQFLYLVDKGVVNLPTHPMYSNEGMTVYQKGMFSILGADGKGRTGRSVTSGGVAPASFAPTRHGTTATQSWADWLRPAAAVQ